VTTTTLITGGAGFIGSHLCERLLIDNRFVICVDNLSSGSKRNIASLQDHSRFTFLNEDIRTLDTALLPRVDEIYHFASRASPVDFERHPIDIATTNSEGTRNLLEYAVDCDATFLYASTSEIYGDPEVHPQPESYTGNVTVQGPRSCYDEAKRYGETITDAYRREYGIDARVIRLFNVYGPRMRADDGRAIPTFIRQALTGDPITVYGDGTQTRSFCYVEDFIEGVMRLMSEDHVNHSAYNIGNDTEITINELATQIAELVDSRSEITYEPLPEDDPTRRQPDLTRITEETGWEPETSLDDGLSQTITYFNTVL